MSAPLSDLVTELRGQLMDLRSPKTKQTSGVVWRASQLERWLKALEADPATPLEQVQQAYALLNRAAAKLGGVHRAQLLTNLNLLVALIPALKAESELDEKLAKANAAGGR